ncbi:MULTISPECIES: exodeoxyribonuclease V subunit gamma [Gammaproteobacteria]|uniref:exodeoxyribonuclease V subunit gamma n=1 Tax=Gammaproteobacteria TaxID=1236 RepID=UPI000DCF9230|nr:MULTISPECIES: exodeoxyribonuclease V subunit gamma [Gammaproteobacteria]RTE85843.1 exodeoxyribonuclease V subunit gamma [Aliidiomarina sp. B3213]TCZ90156.1 exodeoxyribonuclease V subunit gamma [Lysobacter sp. N42]
MSQALTPGLVAAHSHRLEDLTEVAVSLMKNHPLSPLEEETLLVQSNGIAQWLKIELAKATGIASMLNVTLPARFVWKAYRTVLGSDIPKTSPFDKDRLSWRIMNKLPELIQSDEETFKTLSHYLGETIDQRKLFQLSERIADLFDQYQNYRADWLDAWTNGRSSLGDDQVEVDQKNVWQPVLWKALVEDIGIQHYWTNRAKLHRNFVEKCRSLTTRPEGLPARVVVFGISSIPQQTLEVLDALKGFTQIVLCVNNPCKHYWANIVDGKEALKAALKDANRRHQLKEGEAEDVHDDELHLHAHPLLASWGKQGRDYIHLLDLYDETAAKQESFENLKFELFDEIEPQNMLQQVQNDILHLRPVAETRELWQTPSRDDNSVSFHICHSIQREVEVLHDQLLAAFAKDDTLRPRDIMVMVPDVDAYAPHVGAVFGRFHYGDKRRIPYTLADLGQRHQQPLLMALEMLLTIEESRVTQADVLGLLGVPAIQKRFGLNQNELVELNHWINEAGARWGLASEHREQFGMPSEEKTNSWWFALERMLLGYASGEPETAEQERWLSVEPYHEVAGLSAGAAGKLGALIEALNQWWFTAVSHYSLTDWALHAESLLEAFFAPADDEDLLLLSKVQGELTHLLEVAAESGFNSEVQLNIFKESWLSRVDQPNLNQRFLMGSVNFATLMPMRAIPFKHIYILGMDDLAYPRRQANMDFDLMQNRYRPGDRSRREDDRYLFLEALLSAREKLSISWVGRSAQDNSEWPPSVLVSQLRDHLAQGWCVDSKDKNAFLASLTTEHKLQPFNPEYFSKDSGFFSYAREWYEKDEQSTTQKNAEAPTPWQPEDNQKLALSMQDLVRFMREPAEPFFTKRLRTYFRTEDYETHDSENFSLDGLESWQYRTALLNIAFDELKNKLTTSICAEYSDLSSLQDVFSRQLGVFQREGKLGVKPFSSTLEEAIVAGVEKTVKEMSLCVSMLKEVLPDIDYRIAEGDVVLEAKVSNLFLTHHDRVAQLCVSASKGKIKHQFEPYIRHLMANAAMQKKTGGVATVALFQEESGGEVTRKEFDPISADLAQTRLRELLREYQASLSHPVAVVGEYAVQWLDDYYQAISGELSEGRKKLPVFEPQDAQEEAWLRLQKTLQDVENSDSFIQEFPYTYRVNTNFEDMAEEPEFERLKQHIYAPMVRSMKEQLPICELPEAKGEDS